MIEIEKRLLNILISKTPGYKYQKTNRRPKRRLIAEHFCAANEWRIQI
jgi:hypothetical protein